GERRRRTGYAQEEGLAQRFGPEHGGQQVAGGGLHASRADRVRSRAELPDMGYVGRRGEELLRSAQEIHELEGEWVLAVARRAVIQLDEAGERIAAPPSVLA